MRVLIKISGVSSENVVLPVALNFSCKILDLKIGCAHSCISQTAKEIKVAFLYVCNKINLLLNVMKELLELEEF